MILQSQRTRYDMQGTRIRHAIVRDYTPVRHAPWGLVFAAKRAPRLSPPLAGACLAAAATAPCLTLGPWLYPWGQCFGGTEYGSGTADIETLADGGRGGCGASRVPILCVRQLARHYSPT